MNLPASVLLAMALGFSTLNSTALPKDSCDYFTASCGDKPCGPAYNRNNRTAITGAALQQAPYCYVVQQSFKRVIHSYASTASFIAPNVLITAHHNVKNPAFIQKVTFYDNATGTGIEFNKKELLIIPYKPLQASTDIAVIIFKDPAKIAPLYHGCFSVPTTPPTLPIAAAVHLTGFPCDVPDVMMEKQIPGNKLQADSVAPVWGYDMFTCTGDSGAPLWTTLNNSYTVIGIHHGGREHYFDNTCLNISAQINTEALNWLKTILNQYTAP